MIAMWNMGNRTVSSLDTNVFFSYINWHVSLFFVISPKLLERHNSSKKRPRPPPPHDKGRKSTWITYQKWIEIHHPSNLDANLFSEVWWKKMWRSGPFLRATDVVGATNPCFLCFRSLEAERRCRGAFCFPLFFRSLFLFESNLFLPDPPSQVLLCTSHIFCPGIT